VVGAVAEALGALGCGAASVTDVVGMALSAGIWPDASVLEGATVGCMMAGDASAARSCIVAHADAGAQPSRRAARALLIALRSSGLDDDDATEGALDAVREALGGQATRAPPERRGGRVRGWALRELQATLAAMASSGGDTSEAWADVDAADGTFGAGEEEAAVTVLDGATLAVAVSALTQQGTLDGTDRALQLLRHAAAAAEASAPRWRAAGAAGGAATAEEVAAVCGEAAIEAAAALGVGQDWLPASFSGSVLAVVPVDTDPRDEDALSAHRAQPLPAGTGGVAQGAERTEALVRLVAGAVSVATGWEGEDAAEGTGPWREAWEPVGATDALAVGLVDVAVAAGREDLAGAALRAVMAARAGSAGAPMPPSLLPRLSRWLRSPEHAGTAAFVLRSLAVQVPAFSVPHASVREVAAAASAAADAWVGAMRQHAPPDAAAVQAAATAAHGPDHATVLAQAQAAGRAVSAARPSDGLPPGFACPACGMAATAATGPGEVSSCPAHAVRDPVRLPTAKGSARGAGSVVDWARLPDARPQPRRDNEAGRSADGGGWGQAGGGSDPGACAPGTLAFRLLAPTSVGPACERLLGGAPGSRAWSLLLDASLRVPCASEAWRTARAMRVAGYEPSAAQLAGLRAACALAGNVGRAWDAHVLIARAAKETAPTWRQATRPSSASPPVSALAGALPSWGAMLNAAASDLAPFAARA